MINVNKLREYGRKLLDETNKNAIELLKEENPFSPQELSDIQAIGIDLLMQFKKNNIPTNDVVLILTVCCIFISKDSCEFEKVMEFIRRTGKASYDMSLDILTPAGKC